jgi:hypothetical protein
MFHFIGQCLKHMNNVASSGLAAEKAKNRNTAIDEETAKPGTELTVRESEGCNVLAQHFALRALELHKPEA